MGRFRWMLSATVVSHSGTSWLICRRRRRRRCRRCCDTYYLCVSFVFWIEFSIITIKTVEKVNNATASQRTTESNISCESSGRMIGQHIGATNDSKLDMHVGLPSLFYFRRANYWVWRVRHMQCGRAMLGYVCSECDGNLLQSIRAVRSAIHSNTRAFNL